MTDERKELKVLRVESRYHQIAKINAAKKGVKIQEYIELLIDADEKGRVKWPQTN